MKRLLTAAALLPLLAACAGRFPQPVEVRNASDFDLTCTMLATEIEGNRDKVQYLARLQDEAESQNIVVTTIAAAGLFPAILAWDISDANRVEAAALEERAQHLENVHTSKGCHIQAQMPEGYARYQRRHQEVIDSHGRRLELPINRFVYGRPAWDSLALSGEQR